MRTTLILIFTFVIIQVNGQSFFHYTDSLNHFSIDIPVGWKYVTYKKQKEIVLVAYRPPAPITAGKTDTCRQSININIIESPRVDLDKSFAYFLKLVSEYKLIDKGDGTNNRTQIKWLIETHNNDTDGKTPMHDYDVLAVRDGKTYILTMAVFSSTFDSVKPLLDKIASSFSFTD